MVKAPLVALGAIAALAADYTVIVQKETTHQAAPVS